MMCWVLVQYVCCMFQMLITEEVQFESWTSTIVLKNERGLQPVTLRGRPQGSGQLQVIGYSSTVMGVTSNCRFKFLPHLRTPQYTINVVPALPMIQVSVLNIDTNTTHTRQTPYRKCGAVHASPVIHDHTLICVVM